VLCDKNSTEEDLIEHFSHYGTVEYCKIIRDKITNASKGFCYVKFEKASSAAKALEQANGSLVGVSEFPIKIDIAEAKGAHTQSTVNAKFSSEPEDTPPRSRLFVVCPKEMSETQLVDCFSQFPDFEYGKVIVDKSTGESKGFAYVKFDRASSAAMALETVNDTGHIDDMRVKVLVADPKAKRRSSDPNAPHWPQTNQWDMNQQGVFVPSYPMPPPMEMPPFYVPYLVPPVMQVHFLVEFDAEVPTEEVQALFSGFEGYESCFFDHTIDSQGDKAKARAHIYFTDPQRAMVAVEKARETQLGSIPLRISWEDPYAPPAVPNYYPLPPYPYYPSQYPGPWDGHQGDFNQARGAHVWIHPSIVDGTF